MRRTREKIPDVPKKHNTTNTAAEKPSYPGRVLVCAPSNVAADEICRRISLTGVNVVRLMAISKEEMISPVQELCVHVKAWERLKDDNDVHSRRRVDAVVMYHV